MQGRKREPSLNNVVSAFAMNIANCMGMMQGAFDVPLAYTGDPVVGGNPSGNIFPRPCSWGKWWEPFLGRATFLELCHQFDHPEIYGSWKKDSMVGKAQYSLSLIARMANDLISRGMEFMGSQGYAREGLCRKYLRDITAVKLGFGRGATGFLLRLPGFLSPGLLFIRSGQAMK